MLWLGAFSWMAIALSLTLMLELPILSLFFRKYSLHMNDFRNSLKVFVYTNIATNLPLNAFFVLFGGFITASWRSYTIMIVLEILIMAIEGFIYCKFFECGKVRCFIASAVANIVSSGLGLLIVYSALRVY